jgi:hypothetical protein
LGLKSALPVVIVSVSKKQRCLLSAEKGFLKWRYFMNNIPVLVHLIFKENNNFGEYHHVFRALRVHPTESFSINL